MRFALFVAAAVALLAGLWIALRPLPAPAPAPAGVPTAAGAAADPAQAAPEALTQRFSLSAPVPPGGAENRVLRVRSGDTVELTVTSASDDEMHLHGYDLALRLRAGEPATLRFVAEHAGRFEIELHRTHAEIGALEVLPR